MIKVRLYLYDSTQVKNGYRGEDFSNYVLQGVQNVEDLTQELDFTEITLTGINRKEAFEPATKFIIDIEENGIIANSSNKTPLTYHRIVKEDFVVQPILTDDTYFEHQISLIEPSVIAQKTLVDNIACTYKLKDVSLETESPYEEGGTAPFSQSLPTGAPIWEYGAVVPPVDYTVDEWGGLPVQFGKTFKWENTPIQIQSKDFNYNIATNTYYLNSNLETRKAKFIIPKLAIYQTIISESEVGGGFANGYYIPLGYASLYYEIKESNLSGSSEKVIKTGEIISNSNLNPLIEYENTTIGANSDFVTSDTYRNEYLNELPLGTSTTYIKRYTNTSAPDPSYEIEFDYIPDKKYTINVSLYTFDKPSNIEVGYDISSRVLKYFKKENGMVGGGDSNYTFFALADFEMASSFFIYSVTPKSILFASGNKYSALFFIEKAICNTYIHKKQLGIYSGDLNYKDENGYSYNSLFYIDETFVDVLAKTSVIENFYNQKNLWEILVEIGYYIHAIPELKFGENNKLMITFNKLGETTETSQTTTPMTINNFRGIDDYISETNSYVANMVQLGGEITELVSPKSSSEDYLVYNDVAEIQVSKPIIELLKVRIYNNKDRTFNEGSKHITFNVGWYEATQYFYEENVYKLLGIKYNEIPNKGISMYYKLRDNKIIGGNYQLPQAQSNILSDYSFKKIIYCAMRGEYPSNVTPDDNIIEGYWTSIKVNDYAFEVTYRTQDNVRVTHTRPDLRKYLTMPYVNIPKWQQFNNQQEIVVDSEKFGNNIYGALIRTGNNNYQIKEWVDSPTKLKLKGEILRINSEIYYVSKVINEYFTDKIFSTITYSKDYNQLSKVIGIPSEPRFYEISEQSLITRDVSIDDYILIGTGNNFTTSLSETYLIDTSHLRKLILGVEEGQEIDYSSYVITTFKGDNSIGTVEGTFGLKDLYKNILTPLNAYSSGTTLTYSWAMKDNFSAGDKVSETEKNETINSKTTAYRSLEAVQYTDYYGKATLFDFYILANNAIDKLNTIEGIRNLPNCPFDPNEEPSLLSGNEWNCVASNVNDFSIDKHDRGLILLKDSREAIRFNYNLSAITTSDTFIFSSLLFTPKSRCKVAFCNKEINKFSNGTLLTNTIIKTVDLTNKRISSLKHTSPFNKNQLTQAQFTIDIKGIIKDRLTNDEKQNIKSIALVHDYSSQQSLGLTKFSIARNIPNESMLNENWTIGTPNKDALFKNKQ